MVALEGTYEIVKAIFPSVGAEWVRWLGETIAVLFPDAPCELRIIFASDKSLRLNVHTDMDRENFRIRQRLIYDAMNGSGYHGIYLHFTIVQMLPSASAESA